MSTEIRSVVGKWVSRTRDEGDTEGPDIHSIYLVSQNMCIEIFVDVYPDKTDWTLYCEESGDADADGVVRGKNHTARAKAAAAKAATRILKQAIKSAEASLRAPEWDGKE